MKNLILNVVRSFKKNKISILGLIFLLFFGLGVFAVMSNTTSNIKNEYTSLSTKGKLHDFTVAELYDVGKADYLANQHRGISYTYNGSTYAFNKIDDLGEAGNKIPVSLFYYENALSQRAGTYYVPLPTLNLYYDEATTTYYYSRTYNIALSESVSTGLYADFAKDHVGTRFTTFAYTTPTETSFGELPTNIATLSDALNNWSTITTETQRALCINSVFAQDYNSFNAFVNEKTSNIYSMMTTSDTPMAKYINKQFGKEVEQGYFESVNVTAASGKDKIFYKIINSNPEDKIDKMVLFEDPNGRDGNYLFSTNDWAPFNSEVEFYDLQNNKIKPGTYFDIGPDSFYLPQDFNEVVEMPLYSVDEMLDWETEDDTAREARYVYSQIIHIRFKRMFAGDFSVDDATFKPMIETIASVTFDRAQYNAAIYNMYTNAEQTPQQIAYDNYLNYWYGRGLLSATESLNINSNGNVVFSWTSPFGSPSTLTISNWTSKFSVVNPQHLNKTNKRVLSPSALNGFEPYRQWHDAMFNRFPSGEINQERAKQWFNTLNTDQLMFWINPYDKPEWKSMEYVIPSTQQRIIVNKGTNKGQWNGIDKKYIADCGGYNQIIWGCGLTPDFMYPIVDITRPTPNPSKECLVYCNDSGYNSVKLAFVNSPVEEYLVARFKPNVNSIRRQAIIDKINAWAHTEESGMILPKETKCAYFANDTTNVLNCSGFRIAYIPQLVNVVQIVSAVLCSFIGILCLIICFVIIKRYIERNRINIGIMRANGIKKWHIAVSLFPFALFPAIIGGIAAYFTGLFLQGPMLSLFSNYWMLPTPLISFDWISFLACIFVPFLLFTLICFVSTFLVLRTKAVELMKAGSEFKVNGFSRIAKKPFKHFGILTRFRVALAFNSITRLLVLAAMSCLTMSSLVLAFTTFDKLGISQNINSSQFDYKFNIELTTPTSTGGPYSTYDYSKWVDKETQTTTGFGYSDPSQYIFNTYWNTSAESEQGYPWYTPEGTSYPELTKPYMVNEFMNFVSAEYTTQQYKNAIRNNGLIQFPSAADATGQNEDLTYLQNKTNSRITLDYSIGLSGVASSNPWEIALALMPANSRNISADSFNKLCNYAGHKISEAKTKFIEKATELGLPVDTETGTITDIAGAYETQVYQAAEAAGKWYTPIWVPSLPSYWTNVNNGFFAYDASTDTYTLRTDISVVGDTLPVRFNPYFISLLKTIYTDAEAMKIEYPIVYGIIPINWKQYDDPKKLDETYTYVQANFKELSNGHKFDKTHEIKIEGIKENSNYINLTDKKGNKLNSWLFSPQYLSSMGINSDTHPIIINAYTAHKYNLKKGDSFKVIINNDVDRFVQKINKKYHPEQYKENPIVKFKVVGVSVGTNNETYYTTQDIANKVLGLPDGQSWNRTHKYMIWSRDPSASWDPSTPGKTVPALADLAGLHASSSGQDNKISVYAMDNGSAFTPMPQIDESIDKLTTPIPVGFNGIYTHNNSGRPITNSMSLYAYTGMYLGTSVYKSQGDINKFTDVLSFGPNLALANIMTGINIDEYYQACYEHLTNPSYDISDEVEKFIDVIVQIYGETSMVTSICGATDVAASDLIYSNLVSTFNLAETTIMAIIIPITIIIVAVISNLIIDDSKKMAAMLKALGYSDAKNLMSILALFVPTILFGLLLAIPLSFGLVLGYQSIIFNTANILVDVTQKWWYYIAAIGGIGIILVGTYAIGYVSLKRDRLVDQIK